MRLKSILAAAFVAFMFIGMLAALGNIQNVKALAQRQEPTCHDGFGSPICVFLHLGITDVTKPVRRHTLDTIWGTQDGAAQRRQVFDVEPQQITTPATAYSIFVRNGILYIFGLNRHLYRSTNGGASYTDLHIFPGLTRPGESMYVTKNDTIILSVMSANGDTDYLYRSGDHGSTFALVKTNSTMFRRMTEDELGNLYYGTYGTGAGDAPSSEHPWVFKSTDNGVTWNIVLNETAKGYRHIHDVTFDGTNVWVLVGEHVRPLTGGEVAYSSNHGSSWTYHTLRDTMTTIAVTSTQVVLGNDAQQAYILVLNRPSLATNTTVSPTLKSSMDYWDSTVYLNGPPVYLATVCDNANPQAASVYRYNGTSLIPIMTNIAPQFYGYMEISKEQIGGYYFVLLMSGKSHDLFKFTDRGYQSVTQPITLVSPVGARTVTYKLSGCNVTPTTILGDGSSHGVSADPSCLLTVTAPTSQPTLLWRFRYGVLYGAASTWQFYTCASGICSAQTNTWYSMVILLLIGWSIIVGVAAMSHTNNKRERRS
jgi:hypothetical protein